MGVKDGRVFPFAIFSKPHAAQHPSTKPSVLPRGCPWDGVVHPPCLGQRHLMPVALLASGAIPLCLLYPPASQPSFPLQWGTRSVLGGHLIPLPPSHGEEKGLMPGSRAAGGRKNEIPSRCPAKSGHKYLPACPVGRGETTIASGSLLILMPNKAPTCPACPPSSSWLGSPCKAFEEGTFGVRGTPAPSGAPTSRELCGVDRALGAGILFRNTARVCLAWLMRLFWGFHSAPRALATTAG